VVTHQLQVERRTGKVRVSKTDVLPTVTVVSLVCLPRLKIPVLLIAPSICQLENVLHLCEQELYWLDMAVNQIQLSELPVGLAVTSEARCLNNNNNNIRRLTGSMLLWVE